MPRRSDGRGVTALLAATHGNHIEAARLLIAAGADVNAKDNIEDSPFLYAGAEGRNDILEDDACRRRRPEKRKSLWRHRAHSRPRITVIPRRVKILLATTIDKDHVNKLGWTALLEAVILRRWRKDPHRDRSPPGRGRSQSEHRRPGRRFAARACEKTRLHRHGPHSGKGRREVATGRWPPFIWALNRPISRPLPDCTGKPP